MKPNRHRSTDHFPRTRRLAVAVAVASVCSASGVAFAAEGAIEEVIVTAQKRAERLQDVPIAITAMTAGQIEARGVSDVLSLGSMAPNLQVSTYPTSNLTSQVAIRGGGTFNAAMYWEPSVGMYLDGVYLGKAVGSVFDMVDLERIEVLRGPQGTLYGRNTMSGAINYVTRKPSGEFGGTAGIEIGNYGRHVEKLSLDLPKFGIASVSLGVRSEKRDGLVKVSSGPVSEYDDRDKFGARLAVLLDVSKDVKVDYRFDYTKVNQNGQYNQLYRLPPATIAAMRASPVPAISGTANALAPAIPFASQDRLKDVRVDYPSWERMELQGNAITATWALDDRNTLKWISSHRKLDNNDSFDLDGTPVWLFTGKRLADYTQTSHELQWVGNTDRLKYVVGLYHYKDGGYTFNPHENMYGRSNDSSEYGYGGTAKSLYGQVEYTLTDAWTLSAGLRRTQEDKWGSRYKRVWGAAANPATAIMPAVYGTASFSATTPMVSASYKISDRMNVYAKYSEGFKSGSFQGEAPNVAEALRPFKPENQKTYEVGTKLSSEDGRLQLNAALFQNEVDDLQLSQFTGTPGLSLIRNAGKAELKGLELELAWRPVNALRLQAGYGYLDSKYKEYMEAPAANQPVSNVAGNRSMPHAPKHTFNLSADANLGTTAYGRLRAIADYVYTASFYGYAYQINRVDPGRPVADDSKIKGYGLLNLRLVLAGIPVGGPGNADMALWVKNVTNKQQPVNYIDFGPGVGNLMLAYFNEPRTYGMSFNYRW